MNIIFTIIMEGDSDKDITFINIVTAWPNIKMLQNNNFFVVL